MEERDVHWSSTLLAESDLGFQSASYKLYFAVGPETQKDTSSSWLISIPIPMKNPIELAQEADTKAVFYIAIGLQKSTLANLCLHCFFSTFCVLSLINDVNSVYRSSSWLISIPIPMKNPIELAQEADTKICEVAKPAILRGHCIEGRTSDVVTWQMVSDLSLSNHSMKLLFEFCLRRALSS
ncbi:hypothetical protein C4D60_Mb08t18810 [Musa balbisiana]|uniref:Uncharacterized protein n=1 Tax=Musa balbisiana TaxID=52838 RepID=A0A4V4H916_MUSBA|nr:hypothetical protein C4D60_Mb08t18810 [Musa balbisiana]